jgi:hypothetical protein
LRAHEAGIAFEEPRMLQGLARFPSFTCALLALTLVAFPSARAQTVSAGVSGYTAVGSGPIPESDWQHIVVTRNDGPLHSEASGSGGQLTIIPGVPFGDGVTGPGQTSASAAGFASADPGVLHVYASDEAVARGPAAPPNLPPIANLATVYTDIEVGASFTDFLTVHAEGLAVGTEVQLPFVYMAEFLTNSQFFAPAFSGQPMTVGGVFTIPGLGPQSFTTNPFRNSFQSTLLPSGLFLQYLHSRPFSVTVHVGDVLSIGATFSITGSAQITDTNRVFELGTFADGRNTAALWLGALADGVTVTSASGHDYTIDPTAIPVIGPVPEPQTYALMMAGLACLGYVSRRRRAQATRAWPIVG